MAGAELALEASPRSVPLARRWLRDVLGLDPQYDLDTACLLLSELTTNVLLHARTQMLVRAVDEGSALRVEVCDFAAGLGAARAMPESMDGESGRGLAIVTLLAADWGVEDRHDGRTVWFTLPSTGSGAPRAARRQSTGTPSTDLDVSA